MLALLTTSQVALDKSHGICIPPLPDLKAPRGILWFIMAIATWRISRINNRRFLCYKTVEKLFNLSMTLFPHLKAGMKIATIKGGYKN